MNCYPLIESFLSKEDGVDIFKYMVSGLIKKKKKTYRNTGGTPPFPQSYSHSMGERLDWKQYIL